MQLHPSPSQILELWLVYTSSVDIFTKIVHRPTVTKMLRIAKDHTDSLDPATEVLMVSIYLAAINILEEHEVLSRFGAGKDSLISSYQSALDSFLHAADSSKSMSLEILQATVIYLVSFDFRNKVEILSLTSISQACLRRQPGPGTTIPSVFALAVKFARRLGLDDSENYTTVTPFEAEMRRRAWWMICRHESAFAEESRKRRSSIMNETDVPFPMNYNDDDLDPDMIILPTPRIGLTEMSFPLMALENNRMTAKIALRLLLKKERIKDFTSSAQEMVRSSSLREETRDLYEGTKRKIEQEILQYCDYTRPFDWLLLLVGKIILVSSWILNPTI